MYAQARHIGSTLILAAVLVMSTSKYFEWRVSYARRNIAEFCRACGRSRISIRQQQFCTGRRSAQPVQQQEEAKPTPAVSVKKSITPDYIISLEDGKPYKSMKRHLGTLGLTPEAYREKWGLPRDYPMVAPNYAAKRSEMAKSMGLGQQRSKAAQPKAAVHESVKTAPAKAPAKRGRKKSV